MLSVQSVGKKYGQFAALDGVSFELGHGEVVAVIGANGAGKSTLIKCVVGLVHFQGQVLVGGVDVSRKGKVARGAIGYLPQQPAFHPDLTVRETMGFFSELRNAPDGQGHDLVAQVGLEAKHDARIAELSGGMRQRLGLAVALLGDPALLVLDEPATGLDISARLELRRLVNEQRLAGKSILLSTHWLDDVPYVADRALLLDKGRIVYDGSAAALANGQAAGSRLYLRLNGHSPEAIPVIRRFTGEAEDGIGRSGDWVIAKCPASQKAQLVEALIAAGVTILDFRVEEAPVDEAVLKLQGRELN